MLFYGVDRLIEERKREFDAYDPEEMTEDVIRDREEMFEQLEAFKSFKKNGQLPMVLIAP